jgi:predicted CXXCH cytochrome family protein
VVVVVGAARAAEPPGVCARCHESEAAANNAVGGHAPKLDCLSCHEIRRPGHFGPGHASKPACTSHHDTMGHPPAAVAHARRDPSRVCLRCHDPHGSTNLALVRPALRLRGRLRAVELIDDSGASPTGFTHPDAPGTGVCETCHRSTDFYRANGRGKPHFTQSCLLCHEHDASFEPIAAAKNCAICHGDEAARLAKPSLHHDRFDCTTCHAEVNPTPGMGHRRVPACADCHTDTLTHAPPHEPPFACTDCHDVHGSDNAALVRTAIQTPGGMAAVRFTGDLSGRADGSFASASAPGTGVCEVCHTTTQFYRADGTGDPHFTFSCLPCHRHTNGFLPQ